MSLRFSDFYCSKFTKSWAELNYIPDFSASFPAAVVPFQRSFSVARPIRARIREMIQKRITIVGSAQPFFS